MKTMQLKKSRNQRGAVLLVSLIMLLVTTFVGFSTMETSNMEAKMATSRELKELTFQTAETAIDLTLEEVQADDTPDDTDTLVGRALNAGIKGEANPTASYTLSNSYLTNTVEVELLGEFHTPGYSVVANDGSTVIATVYYTMVSVGGRTNTNITSTHTQGFFVVQPTAN